MRIPSLPDALWWLAVKSVQPDPPHVARVKRLAGDVVAAAQLTNLAFPKKEETPC